MIGRTLGHYRIEEKLGEGGMGEVYRAVNENLGSDVALKVLPTGKVSDETARKRFRTEAQTLSKLSHPYIAAIHDFASHDGTDFLVMEYVAGETLADKLKDKPLELKEIVRLGGQIAEALEEAHDHGIIHRDLKPKNIALTHKGHAKVLDFGIAKLVLSTEEKAEAVTVDTLSKTVGMTGTLPYMAPEQLRGGTLDARSDIYSFGVTLYESATGQRPFAQRDTVALLDAIRHQPPQSPSRLRPDLAPTLETLILKCMEKDPDNRYQHASEIGVDLRRLQRDISAIDPAAGAAGLDSTAPPTATSPRFGWPAAIGAAVLVALLAALMGFNVAGVRDKFFGEGLPVKIDSIAVLPLANLMNDPEQEYFVEGMHEALITELSKISALKVISHTSTHRVGTEDNLPKVAEVLGVKAILEGSILRAGDRIQVTVQLIDGRTDEHIWADTFDGELGNVIGVMSDIARRVAERIQVALTPEDNSRLISARPVKPEAYELYLKGNFQMGKLTEQGFGKALKHFQQAIERAPNYAPAYAGAALAYLGLGSWHTSIPPKTVHEKAKQNALKAIELDDGLGDAHIALGRIKQLHEWDWTGADISFKHGIELNPGSTFARILYANYLTAMGRFEESIKAGKRTVETDPLSPAAYNELGWALEYAGRYDEALEQYQKGLELNPDFPQSHGLLASFYIDRGMTEEALEHLPKIESMLGKDMAPGNLGLMGLAYGMAGRRAEAETILEELHKRATKEYVPAVYLADVYLGLGEREEALRSLEEAYAGREIALVWLKVGASYDQLRDDPRFQDLLRRMNFPDN